MLQACKNVPRVSRVFFVCINYFIMAFNINSHLQKLSIFLISWPVAVLNINAKPKASWDPEAREEPVVAKGNKVKGHGPFVLQPVKLSHTFNYYLAGLVRQ